MSALAGYRLTIQMTSCARMPPWPRHSRTRPRQIPLTRDAIQQTNSWHTHEGVEYRWDQESAQYWRHDIPVLFAFARHGRRKPVRTRSGTHTYFSDFQITLWTLFLNFAKTKINLSNSVLIFDFFKPHSKQFLF